MRTLKGLAGTKPSSFRKDATDFEEKEKEYEVGWVGRSGRARMRLGRGKNVINM